MERTPRHRLANPKRARHERAVPDQAHPEPGPADSEPARPEHDHSRTERPRSDSEPERPDSRLARPGPAWPDGEQPRRSVETRPDEVRSFDALWSDGHWEHRPDPES